VQCSIGVPGEKLGTGGTCTCGIQLKVSLRAVRRASQAPEAVHSVLQLCRGSAESIMKSSGVEIALPSTV
jgi:hypothetical protein